MIYEIQKTNTITIKYHENIMGQKRAYDRFWFCQLDPSLNLNSVQSALRSLLKKNYIEVSDIVYSGKVLTRRYIPVVSSEDYASENINGVLKDLLSSNILLQYVESENDIKVIERLQEKLAERKKVLERKSWYDTCELWFCI